ncbi:hypothetical protein FAM09_24835 [Niastella caeni]|uniref:Phage tail tape measure protein n=1 Tax=Niastella caeni TaxID=2569763 RepID=A0A4S8HGF9_9BACT|nr:hypothetical protein [Niastella caeni]THU34248.1 hypothetical protein FAM09_24835 [Niastella caeni]
MATTVNRNVNIFIQSGEAEKAYDRLIKKEQQLKIELEKATDPKQIQRLTTEINKLQEPIDRAGKKLRGELQPSIRELQTTLAALNKEFLVVDQGTARFHQLGVQIQSVKNALADAKSKAGNIDESLTKKAFGSVSGFLEGAGLGAGIATVQALGSAVRSFFNSSIEEALQAENATARFRNTLDNIGRADAFDRLSGKAQKMADKFKFLDNDDVVEVFNNLITYGKLTEKQIDELTPIIVNFAAKNRISLDEASRVIIKALEGNGKALKDYGIKIKETSSETERFSIITGLLKEKVDGAAESFGESLPGALAKSEQKLKDIQESIGTKLLPLKVKLLSFVDDVATGFTKLSSTISLSLKTGLNIFQADDLRRNIEAFSKFTTDQAQKEFDAIANLSAADLTSELIKLNSELEKTEKLLTGAKRQGDSSSDRAERYRLRIEVIKKLIPQIKAQINEADKLLGLGGAETEDPAKKSKIENLFQKFKEQLLEQAREIDIINKAQIDKELIANEIKYDKQLFQLKEALKKKQLTEDQFIILSIQNDDNRLNEQSQIYDRWVKEINHKRLEEEKKNQQRIREIEEHRLQQLLVFQEKVARSAAETADKALGRRQFQLEVDELLATGKERTAIKIKQLELERDKEISNAEKTGKDIADINRKYQKLIADEKLQGTVNLINQIVGFIQNASLVLNAFFDAANQRDQQQLEQERLSNDRKKELYKRQLDGRVISQKEYDKKVQQVEKQQEEREKQVRIREFNRNKATNFVNTSITVARGVAEALATPPVPNIGLAAFMGILGAIQLGFIAAQKPPKFAKGGRLDGPTHSQGGMPIINPSTGRKVAEVEGGEVILSRNTVRNNAALVDQLLHNSLYNNGAPIVSKWKNTSSSYLNIPVINESMHRVRLFEKGGVIATSSNNEATTANTAVIANLQTSVDNLNAQLAAGITAYLSISQSEKQQQRIDAIRSDATFK